MISNGVLDFKLSVVLGTLNRIECLKKCIESLLKPSKHRLIIYVSDAGSTDGTIDYLKTINDSRVRIILHEKKMGQAKAYNEIFQIIETPYTCWLSDDNEVINSGLDIAIDILESDSKIQMVGLKVKDITGPFIKAPYIGGISEAGILNVNQGVLRTSTLHQMGGFSEEFMDYGIDPDLTARVLFGYGDIVYTKKISILHRRDWGEQDSAQRFSQIKKQENYRKIYREKYCNTEIAKDKTVKGSLLNILKQVFGSRFSLNKKLHRDIFNICMGKYISLLDPITCIFRSYHLRQRREPKLNFIERNVIREAD
jgi:GT2 family glycosyltransferase